jgi:acetyltransferase-like isoleucine patch superfamily enzyme
LHFLALIYGLYGDTVVPNDESVNHVCFPGSDLKKDASWDKNCFFGVKSAVISNIVLGRNVTITAGSLVTRWMYRAHHQGHDDADESR